MLPDVCGSEGERFLSSLGFLCRVITSSIPAVFIHWQRQLPKYTWVATIQIPRIVLGARRNRVKAES